MSNYQKFILETKEWEIDLEKEFPEVIENYLPCSSDEQKTKIIFGSYKLSKKVVNRILSETYTNNVHDKNNNVYSTNKSKIGNNELITLISLSKVCDNKGVVHELTYKDIIELTGNVFCIKTVYNILNSLQEKKYITYTKTGWGIYRITILNNDFSRKGSYKEQYINTNHDFFIPGTEAYEKFSKLSINSKKVILYLLMNYNQKRGFAFKNSTLSKILGIKNYRRIRSYLDEIKSLFPNFEIRQMRNDAVTTFRSSKFFLVSNTSIRMDQWTYVKHMLHRFILDYHIRVGSKLLNAKENLHYYLNELFNLITTYNKVLSIDLIKKVIFRNLLKFGYLHVDILKVINKTLDSERKFVLNN